jgi:hypothetical protein
MVFECGPTHLPVFHPTPTSSHFRARLEVCTRLRTLARELMRSQEACSARPSASNALAVTRALSLVQV